MLPKQHVTKNQTLFLSFFAIEHFHGLQEFDDKSKTGVIIIVLTSAGTKTISEDKFQGY